MFTYCPACAAKGIRYEDNKRLFCPACGFTMYQNTAAATGCVISRGREILLLTRGKEPAIGKYDLPGGFVDPGEGALDCLRRECREELGWTPEDRPITLFASFPNTYRYKGISYSTCDLFFTLDAPDLELDMLCLEKAEISAAAFIDIRNINDKDVAFDSTRRALHAYRERQGL
jgi:ADP-ribose pyrophosphatase YjhB (NUDIX family)